MVVFRHSKYIQVSSIILGRHHAHAVIYIIRLTNFARPRGFDALLNLLPGNPFRQEGGDGPQAHNLAQQAHHPAPFQAIPRGIDAFGDHRGVFGARLEDVHMHLRELDEGHRRREGVHQALEARLVALRAQVAAIQRDGPAPAARPNRRQRDARY